MIELYQPELLKKSKDILNLGGTKKILQKSTSAFTTQLCEAGVTQLWQELLGLGVSLLTLARCYRAAALPHVQLVFVANQIRFLPSPCLGREGFIVLHMDPLKRRPVGF